MQDKSFHQTEHEAWSQRAGDYDTFFSSISNQAINPLLDSLGSQTGKRHLDVACGTGHLVAAAAARGAFSEGIDFSESMVTYARSLYPQAHFTVADAAWLPFKNSSLDAVTCSFGLSHMENPQAGVDEAFRMLKPGGRFAFSLWCSGQDGGELYALLKAVLEKHLVVQVELPSDWVRFRYADEKACEAVTRLAGFSPPSFIRVPIVWRPRSAQEVVDTFESLSIRTRKILEKQPADVQHQIRAHLMAALESRRVHGVLTLASPALLTVVDKPA